MSFKTVLFFLGLIFFQQSFSQNTTQEPLVKWDASQKISWHNFQPRETNDKYAAECHTFFRANFYLKNDSVFCQVVSYLNEDSSWRKPWLDVDDAYTINHEQKHFDITEIFARRIRKELIATSANEQETKEIYLSNAKACRVFQEQYDAETRHSLNKNVQIAWDEKIASLLRSLEPYREKDIYIRNPWCKACWKDAPSLVTK